MEEILISQELQNLGLSLIPDFISIEEETELLKVLIKTEETVKKTKSRNSIQRFGSSLPYNSNIVSSAIPEHFNFVVDRLLEQNLVKLRPDSVTVNEYQKGQEITPHIDSKNSGRIITILSLLGDATMKFNFKKEEHSMLYPARALVQMRGVIRDFWQHSILPVPAPRFSIVFRQSQAK